MIYKNVLEIIGNTPIVKLNQVTKGLDANFFGKVEFTNPGGSIKDRIGWYMIEDAEKRGVLKPGGTIVEGTSGNTGVGLAIAAAIKGYKCVFVLPDKMSEEKIKNLRAFGAKVVVAPTAVEPEDPRSYYSVSKRLGRETPNALYIDQYNNLANREIHYKSTGPEILKQFPDVDVIVAGIGTGGTVCGLGRFFKEKKPSLKMVAVDPIGSTVYDKFKFNRDVQAHPYKIEGIGEDFFPANYDFDVISDMVQIEDKETFVMTRDLLTKEGLYCGVSSGGAVVGAIKWFKENSGEMKGKNILVILPDSGNRYLSKVYDDDWMREAGFLDTSGLGRVSDLVNSIKTKPDVVMALTTDSLSKVIELMHDRSISQMPVRDTNGWIKGVINETQVLNALYQNKAKASDKVEGYMDTGVEYVKLEDPIEKISAMVSKGKTALVTEKGENSKVIGIITKIDLLSYLSQKLQSN